MFPRGPDSNLALRLELRNLKFEFMGGVGDGCVDVFGSVRRVFREFRFAFGDSFGCLKKHDVIPIAHTRIKRKKLTFFASFIRL